MARLLRRSSTGLALVLAAMLPGQAIAQSSLPEATPLPFARPDKQPSRIDRFLDRESATEDAPVDASIARLSSALTDLDAGRPDAIRALVQDGTAPPLDRKLARWMLVTSTRGDATSREIVEAMAALPGWPSTRTMRRNLESALSGERVRPESVIALLGGQEPSTVEGLTVLLEAHLQRGERAEAARILRGYWAKARLNAAEEVALLARFGDLLTQGDHRLRMEQMLHDERHPSASRAAVLAGTGAVALAEAWSSVNRNRADAASLLDAIPNAERGAGWLFAKARSLRRTGDFAAAADIMTSAPTDAATLVDPDAWWVERRVLSRELFDVGDPQSAYDIAVAHNAVSPASIADAEFHAGWYALRHLNRPDEALVHFRRIAEVTSGPISQARAGYWTGRALEASGEDGAEEQFRRAATHGSTFYGQLAASRLGIQKLSIADPLPSELDHRRFEAREIVQAIRRFEQAGATDKARSFYLHAAETIPGPGELSLLARMAMDRMGPHVALRVAKAASAAGVDLGGLQHPTGVIPEEAAIAGAGAALAYAIGRQESEFNVAAVSPAGARGLLQLLPGTARDMARQSGMPYSAARLTTDAGYNAALGSTFLGRQLERFDGSYILTFVGYNAGPRRADQWIARYGDPRGAALDTVIDWIERIPFTETRNYVQRVMENYQVYKMRLGGRFELEQDLRVGRRG